MRRPQRPRVLRILVRTELPPDPKSHYKKAEAGDVSKAETAAALQKRLVGGSFQTVSQSASRQRAPQESISEQVREVTRSGRGGDGRGAVG